MKILVVDDEKVLVKGIKFNLESEGYQVEAGYDGEEAVELGLTDGSRPRDLMTREEGAIMARAAAKAR